MTSEDFFIILPSELAPIRSRRLRIEIGRTDKQIKANIMDAQGLSALCDRFAKYSTAIRIRKTAATTGLLSRFRVVREAEEAKLPYHINLVDLLRANENAHSKILGALLRQHSSEGYVILSSFYNLISKKTTASA
ncbi:MAG: hypothetical protein K2O63_07445 [Alistipes sp.]|nr:hypothetical protein [Alistipes sp.]